MDPIGGGLEAARGRVCRDASVLMRAQGTGAYREACERSSASRLVQDHRSAAHWRMVAHEIGRRTLPAIPAEMRRA